MANPTVRRPWDDDDDISYLDFTQLHRVDKEEEVRLALSTSHAMTTSAVRCPWDDAAVMTDCEFAELTRFEAGVRHAQCTTKSVGAQNREVLTAPPEVHAMAVSVSTGGRNRDTPTALPEVIAMTVRFPSVFGSLDAEQLLASTADAHAPLIVVACAGSGKTRSMVARIAYLLAVGAAKPSDIACITFTRSAASDAQLKLNGALAAISSAGGRCGNGKDVFVGTIHKLALAILRQSGVAVNISHSRDSHLRMLHAMNACGYTGDWTPSSTHTVAQAAAAQKRRLRLLARALLVEWSAARHLCIRASRYRPAVRAVFEHYDDTSFAEGTHDLDDIVPRATRVIGMSRAAAAFAMSRTRFLLIDEFQDTSVAQLTFIRRLLQLQQDGHANATSGPRVTAFGDLRQAIYGFQGANPDNFAVLNTCCPRAKIVRLSRNYRSQAHIVNTSDAVAAGIHSFAARYADSAVDPQIAQRFLVLSRDPSIAVLPPGERVIIIEAAGPREEFAYVRALILHGLPANVPVAPTGKSETRCIAQPKQSRQALTGRLSDIAVLARTNRVVLELAYAFREGCVPYMREGSSVFRLPPVVRIIALLRLALIEPYDVKSLAEGIALWGIENEADVAAWVMQLAATNQFGGVDVDATSIQSATADAIYAALSAAALIADAASAEMSHLRRQKRARHGPPNIWANASVPNSDARVGGDSSTLPPSVHVWSVADATRLRDFAQWLRSARSRAATHNWQSHFALSFLTAKPVGMSGRCIDAVDPSLSQDAQDLAIESGAQNDVKVSDGDTIAIDGAARAVVSRRSAIPTTSIANTLKREAADFEAYWRNSHATDNEVNILPQEPAILTSGGSAECRGIDISTPAPASTGDSSILLGPAHSVPFGSRAQYEVLARSAASRELNMLSDISPGNAAAVAQVASMIGRTVERFQLINAFASHLAALATDGDVAVDNPILQLPPGPLVDGVHGSAAAGARRPPYSAAPQVAEASHEREAVWLGTVHQAKGREWDTTVIVRCNQGHMPIAQDGVFSSELPSELLAGDGSAGPRQLFDVGSLARGGVNEDEERRIFYVATSRAKRRLILTCVTRDPLLGDILPSTYLRDVPQSASECWYQHCATEEPVCGRSGEWRVS